MSITAFVSISNKRNATNLFDSQEILSPLLSHQFLQRPFILGQLVLLQKIIEMPWRHFGLLGRKPLVVIRLDQGVQGRGAGAAARRGLVKR